MVRRKKRRFHGPAHGQEEDGSGAEGAVLPDRAQEAGQADRREHRQGCLLEEGAVDVPGHGEVRLGQVRSQAGHRECRLGKNGTTNHSAGSSDPAPFIFQ